MVENASNDSEKIEYITNYSGSGIWYWRDDKGSQESWKKYDEDVQTRLEQSFQEIYENSSVKIVVEGRIYTVFPVSLIQINGITGFARRIKFEVTEAGSEPMWFWQDDKDWKSFPDEVSFMINAAANKLKKAQMVEFMVQNTKYTIDLLNLIQMNTATGYKRQVTRKAN